MDSDYQTDNDTFDDLTGSNDGLAPNQVEEVEFLKQAKNKFMDLMDWLENNIPKNSFNHDDMLEVLEDLAYAGGDIESYLSEPIKEDGYEHE